MGPQLYSVEQVADLLHLHVKTVRGYVRDGRLKAVRIGKQYRISSEEVETFTGGALPAPVRETVSRQRHAEVSSIVQVDAASPALVSRLATAVMSSANGRPYDDGRLRIDTVYDQERASLKIVLLGGLETTGEMLKMIHVILEDTP
ncbi:helix-turn-helix domain-containing protein [Fodinicola feengrottensis]|uniref:Helix-turn-helix domain-containing protein n=1 Tax=Fodinicola feengrottensis TaxID=435914 RepID=A0ABN2I0Q6_9ACTN|nr:helix-turn-helix domain-containing protein [Fodinicola feengrottensis]